MSDSLNGEVVGCFACAIEMLRWVSTARGPFKGSFVNKTKPDISGIHVTSCLDVVTPNWAEPIQADDDEKTNPWLVSIFHLAPLLPPLGRTAKAARLPYCPKATEL
jgi:hypothetical protein